MGAEVSSMQQKMTNSNTTRVTSRSIGGSVYPISGQVISNVTAGKVLTFHSPAKWRAHFEASKANDKLMVINFTAVWCVPCRNIEPAISEFANRYQDVEFIKIDADELMGVAMEFGVHIMPTFILMKKGKTVDVITGAKKEELQKKIEKNRGHSYRVLA
ncbi:thioredoxin H2-like [Impatiens glandulifera]|uniref:thioredoxin H2-like n=1 Tax=Impatiens glandulifera TaxID=253017 RepID=UPI001FB0FF35|nr:thioredoxin H2-like [Impatiens glandulifera]